MNAQVRPIERVTIKESAHGRFDPENTNSLIKEIRKDNKSNGTKHGIFYRLVHNTLILF